VDGPGLLELGLGINRVTEVVLGGDGGALVVLGLEVLDELEGLADLGELLLEVKALVLEVGLVGLEL